MKRVTLSAVLAIAMLSAMSAVAPVLAVDTSISPLCRAGADPVYSRPGGYCELLADNHSMASVRGKPGCNVGYVVDPSPPHACVRRHS